jgi:hypothetical protein
MAITRTAPSEGEEPGSAKFVLNNGDLKSLEGTRERLGFLDDASLLRFLIAVASQSATRSLTITDKDGKVTSLNPAPSLIVQNPASSVPPVPPAPTPANS